MQRPTTSVDGVLRTSMRIDFRIERGGLILAAMGLVQDHGHIASRVKVEKRLRRELEERGRSWLDFGIERFENETERAELEAAAERFVSLYFPEFDR